MAAQRGVHRTVTFGIDIANGLGQLSTQSVTCAYLPITEARQFFSMPLSETGPMRDVSVWEKAVRTGNRLNP